MVVVVVVERIEQRQLKEGGNVMKGGEFAFRRVPITAPAVQPHHGIT